MGYKETYGFTEEEWKACTTVLSVLKDDPRNNPDNPFFSGLITKIAKKAKKKMGRVTDGHL